MHFNFDYKKIGTLLPILILLFVLVPIFVGAEEAPLVSADCGVIVDGKINRECGYEDLLQLVNSVINWIIMISVPVSAGVFAWAGFTMMTSADNSGKVEESKRMMWSVAKGLFFILAAWVIVTTIANTLLSPKFPKEIIRVEGVKN